MHRARKELGGREHTAREREHVAQLVHDLLALQLLVGVAQHLKRGGRVRVAALVRVHLRAQRAIGNDAGNTVYGCLLMKHAVEDDTITCNKSTHTQNAQARSL